MASKAKWTLADMPDQTGKVTVVTGANSGLGYETSLAMAQKGAQVVMACRNTDKGNTAREGILKDVPNASLDVMKLDLSSLASVREFATDFQAKYEQLDILFNNAGVMAPPRQETADGFELQMGTNHLGHFALTGLLLDRLLKTSGSRVVNVTSLAQYGGSINFDDFQHKKSYSRYGVYVQTKLANVMFTLGLQRRLEAANTTTISVAAHPGLSATELQKNTVKMTGGGLEGMLYPILMPIMAQSQAQGTLPQLYAATMPQVKGGEHYGPDGIAQMRGYPKLQKVAKAANNQADVERLWQLSEALTGVKYEALATV